MSKAYLLDAQVGYLLRLANQRHATIFQDHTVQGLTPTQFSALVRLAQEGPCSQNQLGRLAAMDIATIKGVVDRLKAKGLLRATADPGDKRRSIISLTEVGVELMEQLYADGFGISQETLAPLKKSEQKTLLALLKKIT